MPVYLSPIGGLLKSPLGGLANEFCCAPCCCGVFAVDPTEFMDLEEYYGSSPVYLYVTFGGDITGTAILRRYADGATPTYSTICIEYRLDPTEHPGYVVYADIVGCPSDEVNDRRIANTIRIRCFAGEDGTRSLEIFWSSGGDGASGSPDGVPDVFTVDCDPFEAFSQLTLTYIIPSSCDGATSRTVTLTITL